MRTTNVCEVPIHVCEDRVFSITYVNIGNSSSILNNDFWTYCRAYFSIWWSIRQFGQLFKFLQTATDRSIEKLIIII